MFGYRLHKRIFVPSDWNFKSYKYDCGGGRANSHFRVGIVDSYNIWRSLHASCLDQRLDLGFCLIWVRVLADQLAESQEHYDPKDRKGARRKDAAKSAKFSGIDARFTFAHNSSIRGAKVAQITVVGKVESCSGRSSHLTARHKLAVITPIS